MYIFYTSSKLNGIPIQADETGGIQGMAGQHFAQGTAAALQKEVHAPLIADSRNWSFQGPQHPQTRNG
jgi:hypothetical protein